MLYVYRMQNLVNGKVYIGQTNNLRERLAGHRYQPTNSHIARSIRLYGRDVFFTKIIETVNDELIDERERFWIAHYHSTDPRHGYNKCDGGNRGTHYNEETRRKISKATKGRVPWNKGQTGVYSDERINQLRQALLSRGPVTEATRQKLRAAHKGKQVSRSQEHQRNLARALKERFTKDPTLSERISESCKGRVPWNKGKPRSEETKRKIRETKRRNRMKQDDS